MITVRHLRNTDILTPPHWPLGDLRPGALSLIAIEDDGKLAGIVWLADGGNAALIGVFLSADPYAAWPLCNAALKLAKNMGCAALVCHVKPGRLLEAYRSRGGIVTEEGAHLVSFSTGV